MVKIIPRWKFKSTGALGRDVLFLLISTKMGKMVMIKTFCILIYHQAQLETGQNLWKYWTGKREVASTRIYRGPIDITNPALLKSYTEVIGGPIYSPFKITRGPVWRNDKFQISQFEKMKHKEEMMQNEKELMCFIIMMIAK